MAATLKINHIAYWGKKKIAHHPPYTDISRKGKTHEVLLCFSAMRHLKTFPFPLRNILKISVDIHWNLLVSAGSSQQLWNPVSWAVLTFLTVLMVKDKEINILIMGSVRNCELSNTAGKAGKAREFAGQQPSGSWRLYETIADAHQFGAVESVIIWWNLPNYSKPPNTNCPALTFSVLL